MTRSIIKDRPKKILTSFIVALFWLAVWQFAYTRLAKDLLLASPAGAFYRLFILAREPLFWNSVANTCFRVVMGFLLAAVAGVILAAASARFKAVCALVSPLFNVIRATPVASFIILVTIWLSSGRLPAFIAFLMVVPIIWSNVLSGITNTDAELLEMAKLFRLTRRRIIRNIYVPSVMPYFLPACSAGLGFAWKSVIAAEVICLPKEAIGRQIYNAKIYLESADLFAWTIAVIIFSVLIEKLTIGALKWINDRILPARPKEADNA